jgi:hypothetical protein
MLGSSLHAIKKLWISIYQRVEDHLSELIPNQQQLELPANGRGKEKRRRLLAYLREHPEELRPIARASHQSHDNITFALQRGNRGAGMA